MSNIWKVKKYFQKILILFNLIDNNRKRWILFSKNDTNYMYPTRIPFEESTIYSQVNIKSPDLNEFPDFKVFY